MSCKHGIMATMPSWSNICAICILTLIVAVSGYTVVTWLGAPVTYSQSFEHATSTNTASSTATTTNSIVDTTWPQPLDTEAYDERLLQLANYTPPLPATTSATSTVATSTAPRPIYDDHNNVRIPGTRWPATAPYPHGGAILPFERIVAYYGNFYSTRMGILGEFDEATVLARLASTSALWEAADPDTPVRPAIHHIAMVAQGTPGTDGMWRNVMPDEHIEQAYRMSQKIDGILFLDLQVGLSTLERELPQFRDYFTRPEVHLGIDPEFSMKQGNPPGSVIGTFDAADINFAIEWLSEIVRENELPPKVLVIHRFTQNMVTNYQDITPTPEVQVVMHMDGWGPVELKKGTYRHFIEPEPVQFTGLKIFYKNDLKPPSTGLFQPEEALQLHPQPIYIQYQ